MNRELESLLDRADELLRELEEEFNKCLSKQNVTEKAKNLTNEVLEKLRSALDHTMRIAWERYVAPNLLEEDRRRARVYFPITNDPGSFYSTLGRGGMANLDKVHKDLYEFLLEHQPFSSKDNRWLKLLADIAAEGKHIRLTPQKRTETQRIKVSRLGGSSVSWNPDAVKFGGEVKVMGAPVNPNTQRIVPTPGVIEEVELWVSFVLENYGVNALGFCKEACQKTRGLIEKMVKTI